MSYSGLSATYIYITQCKRKYIFDVTFYTEEAFEPMYANAPLSIDYRTLLKDTCILKWEMKL